MNHYILKNPGSPPLRFGYHFDGPELILESVELADPDAVLADPDYYSDILDDLTAQAAESEARQREHDTFFSICENLNFLPKTGGADCG